MNKVADTTTSYADKAKKNVDLKSVIKATRVKVIEENDRQCRARNIIIHGVKEPASEIIDEKKTADSNFVDGFIQDLRVPKVDRFRLSLQMKIKNRQLWVA